MPGSSLHDRSRVYTRAAAPMVSLMNRRDTQGVPSAVHRMALLIAVLFTVSGCASLRSAFNPTADFIALPSDSRVRYEPGAEELAASVAAALPEAISSVEEELGRPFAGPIEVHVCASEKRFAALTNSSEDGRGAVVRSLFLSGRLMRPEYRDTVDAVLKHELTHLHLMQRLGYYSFHRNIPAWFNEGLAEAISGGCGGTTVSEGDAERSVLAGNKLIPDDQGGVFVLKDAGDYGLERSMYYRQSGMFTGYLRKRDAGAFAGFVLALEDGTGFRRSFQQKFGMTVDRAWREFELSLRGASNSVAGK